MRTFQTILFPTDFSDSSRQAFEVACSLAQQHGARVIVLHVVPRPLMIPGGVMMSPPPPPPTEEREALHKQLHSIQSPDPSIRLDYRLEEGDAVAGILAVAEEQRCDLIVMGTHGRTGVSRLVLGSIAEQVLRKSPCPVLAVKVPHSHG